MQNTPVYYRFKVLVNFFFFKSRAGAQGYCESLTQSVTLKLWWQGISKGESSFSSAGL